jgi:hypothetical protein
VWEGSSRVALINNGDPCPRQAALLRLLSEHALVGGSERHVLVGVDDGPRDGLKVLLVGHPAPLRVPRP